ncbi:MAG: NADH-quinone oxidoreductase subunit J [Deltaproteobacteria bacterium]|jgi:NADH-quinone oxidoreductase subunit J|nr:NADH-quinone oxidoreductase subunit J [Deltaproteobacteria bacterium]
MEEFVTPLVDSVLNYLGDAINSLQEFLSPYLPEASLAAYVAFAVYTLIILAGAFGAVLSRNLVRAMMGLVLTFLGVAGMYLLLASPFLAFMQLLIYVGAVCVLIFFAIMLTRNTSEGEEARLPGFSALGYGLLSLVAPLAVFLPLLISRGRDLKTKVPEDPGTGVLGEGLLREYVLPFELISIILLVAMAGAVFLAYRGYKPLKGGSE